MAWHCKKQTEPFGEWTTVYLAALPAGNARLSLSYSHATQLTFDVVAPEHTSPIERLAFIKIWDDASKLADGTTDQDEDHPLFEGFAEVVAPGGESNKVRLTFFDPTYRIARELTVMSRPWEAGDPTTDPIEWPTEGTGAIPYLVYNAPDSDSDYAFCRGFNGTIGNIIAGILEDAQEMLFFRNACPADGVDPNVSALPYIWTGEVANMDFVPQETLVWESESVRAGVERVQRYEPRFRLLWEPGTRLWRYTDITAAPQQTIRLNDPTVDFPALSLSLTPSFEKCFTAIKIYGPPQATKEEFVWYHEDHEPEDWTNTLEPVGDSELLEEYTDAGGTHEARTWKRWQIVDTTKRAGARWTPDWYAVLVGTATSPKIVYEWISTKRPTIQLSWDGTEFFAAEGARFDFNQGYVEFVEVFPYVHKTDSRGQSLVAGSTQTYFPPIAVKLVWAPLTDSLSVRVPATGYEGTAYTVAGLELEKKLYDPSLAIGYEYGTAVTTEDREAQFEKLARAQLDKSKNISWTGGVVLDGIDYSWSRLGKRVNFEASDGSGGTVAAGWDAIDAYVTDVEYDLTEQTTTLTFSSDRAEAYGEDVADLKQRLKIKALEQRMIETTQNIFRTDIGWRGNEIKIWSGMNAQIGFEYVDSDTGLVVDRT